MRSLNYSECSVICSFPTYVSSRIYLYLFPLKLNWQPCRCKSHMILVSVFFLWHTGCSFPKYDPRAATTPVPRQQLDASSFELSTIQSIAKTSRQEWDSIPTSTHKLCSWLSEIYLQPNYLLIQIMLQLYMYTIFNKNMYFLKETMAHFLRSSCWICRYNVAKSIFSCRILRKMIATVNGGDRWIKKYYNYISSQEHMHLHDVSEVLYIISVSSQSGYNYAMWTRMDTPRYNNTTKRHVPWVSRNTSKCILNATWHRYAMNAGNTNPKTCSWLC